MSESKPTKIKHRPLLDGTRGVMMCMVLGYHLGGATKLPGAWVAMDFFFVLSGYLITTLLVKEYERQGHLDLGLFYRRRVRRLGPALLATLAGVFIIASFLGGAEAFPGLRKDGIATLFYVANWRFIWSAQSYFASFDLSPLRHAWSLAIEEQFYLVWPVAFLGLAGITRFDRRKMIIVLGLVLFASVLWMRHLSLGNVDLSRAYYGTDTRGQGLIVGSMMALFLWRDRWDTPRDRIVAGWLGTAALIGLLLMMLVFTDSSRAVYTRGGFLLIALTSAVFVFGCARAEQGPLKWIFGNPVSRHMGIVSYSFYLWHWPIIIFMSPERLDWAPWLLDISRVVVALALAEATYWLLEKPIHEQRWVLRRQGLVSATAFAGCLALMVLLTPAPEADRLASATDNPGRSGASSGPTVLLLGDSLAWALSYTAPPDYPYRVEGAGLAHCDIIGNRIYTGDTIDEAHPDCPNWPTSWADALSGRTEDVTGRPEAVLVTLGLRQLFDIEKDGARVTVGSPTWERLYRAAIEQAVEVIRANSEAPVLWLDVPCYRWAAAGTHGEEFDAKRLATVNRVLAETLSTHHNIELIPYAERVCHGPGGTETDAGIRPDGAHMNRDASGEFWRYLIPRLDRLTTTH